MPETFRRRLLCAALLSPGVFVLACYAVAFAAFGVARWLELGDALVVIELEGET